MKNLNKKLMLRQLDKKIEKFSALNDIQIPSIGWIKTIRTALNMSLTQLAKRLNKSLPTVKEIEEREANKSITLNKLMEVGEKLELKLVYGFIPKESSFEKMIEKRAYEIAKDIVMRTSHSMKLEDQENTEERLKEAIKDRANNILNEMPKYLWD